MQCLIDLSTVFSIFEMDQLGKNRRDRWKESLLIIPSRGTKLWAETATTRTIGMPNNEGMRRQPPPEEMGGAKL